MALASVVEALPKISLIKPAVTSSVSAPPIAPKPVVPFKADLAVDVNVIVKVEALGATTVSISLKANVLSAVVVLSPLISQTNLDQSK